MKKIILLVLCVALGVPGFAQKRSKRNQPDTVYVTVHDTGDSNPEHTAEFWSNTVRDEFWEQGKYACSYQYVVGNDGTYHNIPDDEIAWHAGDTTRYDYKLYDANVTGSNPYPKVTISSDGYYEIDGVKSSIQAPRIYKEKNGEVKLEIPLGVYNNIPTITAANLVEENNSWSINLFSTLNHDIVVEAYPQLKVLEEYR